MSRDMQVELFEQNYTSINIKHASRIIDQDYTGVNMKVELLSRMV